MHIVTTHSYTNLESQSQQQFCGLLTSWAQQAPTSTTVSATVWGLRYQRLQCTQYRVQQLKDYVICRVSLRERGIKSEQKVSGCNQCLHSVHTLRSVAAKLITKHIHSNALFIEICNFACMEAQPGSSATELSQGAQPESSAKEHGNTGYQKHAAKIICLFACLGFLLVSTTCSITVL